MFCGHEVDVRSALAATTGPSIDNLMRLAKTAEAATNNDEAYKYYSQVLELNGSNVDAWLGKARSAGWQSSLANPRLNELVILSASAVDCAAPDQKTSVAAQAATGVVEIVGAFWQMAAKNYNEHADPQFPEIVAGLSRQLLGWAQQAFAALDKAIALLEENGAPDHPVYLAYVNLARGFFSFGLAKEFQDSIAARLPAYLEKAKKFDSSVALPEAKSAACYVATVVYGTPYHPDVEVLRDFRDQRLNLTSPGRAFVRFYYSQLGPSLARLSACHPWVRRLGAHCVKSLARRLRSRAS